MVRVMSEAYPSTGEPASISTTISRASFGPPGPPWGKALEGPNCTSPPPGAPRDRISSESRPATSRSVMPTWSAANVAAIDASVMAIACRIKAISSGYLMIRSRSLTGWAVWMCQSPPTPASRR